MSVAFDLNLDVPEFSAPALCAETDPDAFYPDKGGSVAAAKEVCFACDAREDCLQYALDHGLTNAWDGVWGGTTPRERKRMSLSAADRRAERDAQIHALHAEGLTRIEISVRLSMKYTTVGHVLQASAAPAPELAVDVVEPDAPTLVLVPVPPAIELFVEPAPTAAVAVRGWTGDELAVAARQLHAVGMPTGEIAIALDVPAARVRSALRKRRSA